MAGQQASVNVRVIPFGPAVAQFIGVDFHQMTAGWSHFFCRGWCSGKPGTIAQDGRCQLKKSPPTERFVHRGGASEWSVSLEFRLMSASNEPGQRIGGINEWLISKADKTHVPASVEYFLDKSFCLSWRIAR